MQGLIFKILLLASPLFSKFVLLDDPDKDFCVNWKYEERTPSFSFQVALHSCAESRWATLLARAHDFPETKKRLKRSTWSGPRQGASDLKEWQSTPENLENKGIWESKNIFSKSQFPVASPIADPIWQPGGETRPVQSESLKYAWGFRGRQSTGQVSSSRQDLRCNVPHPSTRKKDNVKTPGAKHAQDTLSMESSFRACWKSSWASPWRLAVESWNQLLPYSSYLWALPGNCNHSRWSIQVTDTHPMRNRLAAHLISSQASIPAEFGFYNSATAEINCPSWFQFQSCSVIIHRLGRAIHQTCMALYGYGGNKTISTTAKSQLLAGAKLFWRRRVRPVLLHFSRGAARGRAPVSFQWMAGWVT